VNRLEHPPVETIDGFTLVEKSAIFDTLADILQGTNIHDLPATAYFRHSDMPTGESPRYPGLRVLLVEDNAVNQELCMTILSSFGCQTIIADNGQKALDILKTHDFDVILLDCQMPVMDGYEFIKRVREFDKGVPILAISALNSSKDVDKIIQCGADNYISKPLNSKLFIAQIKLFIDFYLRRKKKFNLSAVNLFSKKVYKRKIEFYVDSENDLVEFWEFLIENIFVNYKI